MNVGRFNGSFILLCCTVGGHSNRLLRYSLFHFLHTPLPPPYPVPVIHSPSAPSRVYGLHAGWFSSSKSVTICSSEKRYPAPKTYK